MHNGRPMYSKDWSIAVEHGGSRIQYETTASVAINGFRTGVGWVLVCGGAPRHAAASRDDATVHAAETWAPVTEWALEDPTDGLTVVQATCDKPATETGYSLPTPSTGDWTRGAFAPTGISCASGYSGTAVATVCPATSQEITLSGCSKNSRRRRKHHKHKHWNNNDAAAPFNPFWWFLITCN